MKNVSTILALGGLVAGVAFAGTGLEITSYTIDGGGRTSSGGTLELSGTIGQADTGDSVGGSLGADAGFWRRLPNNDCTDPIPITAETTPYTTLSATTDGPAHPECEFDGQTYHDAWFVFEANCTGTLTVSTCEDMGGSADYDTDLAVYEGCGTSPCDFALLGCNDDDPDNACGGSPSFHSTVKVPVTEGSCYRIRVGGWNPGHAGTGVLFVGCIPCTGDIDANGEVAFSDLLALLATWGPCPGCPADLDGNTAVEFADLLILLANWGPCP